MGGAANVCNCEDIYETFITLIKLSGTGIIADRLSLIMDSLASSAAIIVVFIVSSWS